MFRRARVYGQAVATWWMAGLLGTLSLSLFSAGAVAAERNETQTQIREALHREIYGLADEKRAMLEQIVAEQPDAAAARWHLGYVQHGDQWLQPAEASELLENDPRLEGYFHRRSTSEDSVAGQLALANWCAKRGLLEREQAHLSRVIQWETDHAEARRRLGFVLTGADWVHRSEIAAAQARQQQQAADLAKRDSATNALLKRMAARSAAHRSQAAEEISQLDQLDWIASLEMRIAPHSPEAAAAAIAALGNMTDPRAMEALARIAVFAPWPPTRVAAAEKLKQWPIENYVPLLLQEMYTPVQTKVAATSDSRGRLIYRHTFSREGQDEAQQMVLDTAYRRLARPGGNRGETLLLAMFQMGGQVAAMEQAATQQNAFTQEMNTRISDVLNVATEQAMPANPRRWWKWWNDHNEVFIGGEKQVKVAYLSNEVTIADQVSSDWDSGASTGSQAPSNSGVSSGSPAPRGDCLVAGTLVWTESGLQAIESIVVGDLVLSQDVESGELAYKPVLRTTIRPAGPLVRLRIGSETIETSGGHLLWITGEGWVKSREIASGADVHGLEGSQPVAAVSGQAAQETHNLVVADFHTYFITEQKLLSHDNTVRRPTAAVVPGLKP